MTIKRITNTSLEANRVILRPQVAYTVTGSDITGSMPLVPNPSPNIKVLEPSSNSSNTGGAEQQPGSPFEFQGGILDTIGMIKGLMLNGSDATSQLNTYLDQAVSSSLPSKNSKQFNMVIENVPGVNLLSGSTNLPISGSRGALPTIVNSIIEKEVASNRNMEFGFTNYNCLGFVSGGNESQNQALMYKNSASTGDFPAFGVSFFIKPPSNTTQEFRPATVFHIDNLITVSLVSGSTQDRFGNTNSFKIVSQLSSSNENRVDAFKYDRGSTAYNHNNSVYPNFQQEVIFTPDNELKKNSWYHVAITVSHVNGLREAKEQKLYIDGNPITGSMTGSSRDVEFYNTSFKNSSGVTNSEIIIGNKINKAIQYSEFFIEKYSLNEKYTRTVTTQPTTNFESPFFGEVHEITFATSQLSSFPIESFLESRYQTLNSSSLNSDLSVDFYLPVLFGAVENQLFRTSPRVLDSGAGTTDESITLLSAPHENWVLSNDLRFPEVNITSFLSSYCFDNKSRTYPRCIGMESIDNVSSDNRFAHLTSNPNSHEAVSELSTFFTRNNLIRSCDNANFVHEYNVYESILDSLGGNNSLKNQRKQFLSSSLGNKDMSHVLMKNYVDYSNIVGSPSFLSNFLTLNSVTSQLSNRLEETTINPIFDKNLLSKRSQDAWYPLLFSETLFRHSNLVSIIDIPQMFYDKRIHPGTFEIIENNLSGSNGMLTYNIKDNGLGALYRNDSAAPEPKNKCGIIFYELGIVVLTHPSLAMIGKENFTINFKGEKDLNVLNINTHVEKYEFNKSSNPSYNSIGKIGSESNQNEITMITGIEYLDENLNVVMRSNLSQPVSKREFDEILFRSRIDF